VSTEKNQAGEKWHDAAPKEPGSLSYLLRNRDSIGAYKKMAVPVFKPY